MIRDLNASARRLFGGDVPDWDAVLSIAHPDDRAAMADARRQASSLGRTVETLHRLRRHGGDYRWFRSRVSPIGTDGEPTEACLFQALDIHETPDAPPLHRSQLEVETILNSISDAFYSVDLDWRFTYVNAAAERLLQHGADELLHGNLWEAFPEAVGGPFQTMFNHARRTGENVEFVEYYPPFETWFQVRAYPFAQGLSVYFRDVTEKVENERELAGKQAELSAAHAKLQRILDHTVDVICTFTRDGHCVEVNRRCLDVWGFTPEELVGRRFADLIHPDDRSISRLQNARILGGEAATSFQMRNFRKDGSVAYTQWSSVWSEEDQLFFNIARDVSEIVEAEVQLRQAQRLEALGKLTGGIAHDFNNLLTVILGNAEFLADQLPEDDELHTLANAIAAAAERGSELNTRLLAFSRRQALTPQVTDINALVGSMDPLLRRSLGGHVEVEIVRGGGLWRALVDPVQLEAALLNLCLNARDAMPGGGRLTVETANAHLDSTYASSHQDVTPGQYVMIAVADTGSGMSADTASRAFEPFFTTKDVGKGSGLGLSMVYGFVKQSGGHVKIYSEEQQGTVVRIYLPRTYDAASSGAAARSPMGELTGKERILLVEDDDMVRGHVQTQLVSFGYEVVAVANGIEALEVLRRGVEFDLLFTDIIMPRGMNGRELATEARRLRPRLPVLFTSGYTENAVIHHGRLDPGVHLLNKPYRRDQLGRKVREVLESGAGDGDA
ncbi:MAG: PAS domain S-box protein [Alphaproteobacteria bacterium]|nr:PAS domain S-box protein [Alphaproteobacteria bacterium]